MNFEALINDSKEFRKVSSTFNSSDADYEEWKNKRKFIAGAIDSDGSILDIGCGGGLFLKTLLFWLPFKLVPYGIDNVPKYIEAAEDLFPENKSHFVLLDSAKIETITYCDLPKEYDYIFWNRGSISDSDDVRNIYRVISMAKRRVIFGLYGRNDNVVDSEEWIKERSSLVNAAGAFRRIVPEVSGQLLNPTKSNQLIMWIDKL